MSAWSAPKAISDVELHDLGVRMECDFTGVQRRRFMDRWDACDVQAAPGSGKTTLLVAKLAHLARNWPFGKQGVCVVSHTNVAKHEIEQRVANIPEAARLLAYPNFVGTLTSFFHTFLALPLLRGLGWPVTCVDNDLFAARILIQARAKPTLSKMLRMSQTERQVRGWLTQLSIADDFEIAHAPAERIKVAQQDRLPGLGATSRAELEELKGELILHFARLRARNG